VELLLTDRRGWEVLADPPTGEPTTAANARGGPPRWRQAEARLLAQRVAELIERGEARAGEIVVLLRALGDLPVYERALRARGLRTLASAGGFWSHLQVGDLLAFLRALANPLDELALYATLASPLVGLSSDGLALLARAAGERGVWESARRALATLPSTDREALGEFCAWFERERRTAPRRTISELIERAIDRGGYREHVLALEEGEQRLANVRKLLALARRYEASEGRDLRGFLDHAAAQDAPAGGVEPDAPADAEREAVRLMSIHAAKGLEFPVVCVADLGRAPNLSVPDLLVGEPVRAAGQTAGGQPQGGGQPAAGAEPALGLRLLALEDPEPRKALRFQELCERRQAMQTEEEERILYVAMTRAREKLLLSGAIDFESWPEERAGAPPIGWVSRALIADLPARARTLEQPIAELTAQGTATKVRCWLNAPRTLGAVLREPARPATSDAPPADETAAANGEPRAPDGARARRATGKQEAPARAEHATGPADPGVQGAPARGDGAAGPADPPLSYTALAELERCGYRFYLERVLHLPENRAAAGARAGDGLDARTRGTLVHKLLETVDFARGEPPPQALARAARELGVRLDEDQQEQVRGLVRAALTTDLGARLAAAQAVRRECPFAFALPSGELVTGVIDVLAREAGGGRLVVDYKSDRVDPDEDLHLLVERDYELQRLIYALAVLRDGAPEVEVVHWFLGRPRETIAAVYAAPERSALEDRLAVRIRSARARAQLVSDRPHRDLCLTCPGRASLCSWGEEQTLRERPSAPDDQIHVPHDHVRLAAAARVRD
jgi:ATP-dependent exoDNAse (exonuclease V) beta subunit